MSIERISEGYKGPLYKYTNVFKGWQLRWFILNSENGTLSYFLSENHHNLQPRGTLQLVSAVVSPSDEDSISFSVETMFGDVLKLRAQNTKARQEWVNRLRAVSERVDASTPSGIVHREHSSVASSSGASTSGSYDTAWDAIRAAREYLFRAEQGHIVLTRGIEELPRSGKLTHVEPDLLMLKASSHAALLALSQCLFILQQQNSQETTSASSQRNRPYQVSRKFTFR